MTKTLLIALFIFSFSHAVLAQDLPPPPSNSNSTTGLRSRAATVIFAGLGGAVIGLSTLSFYEEPQNHLNNVTLGFGLGLILGTAYVTYQSVNVQALRDPIKSVLDAEDLRAKSRHRGVYQLTWAF